jgi:hypothetical protein
MDKEKGQTIIFKSLHRKLNIQQPNPTKARAEFMCFGRVYSSCSTINSCHVTFVTNSSIDNKLVKDRIGITTNGTYQ